MTTDTTAAYPGRPNAIPDERFFKAIQTRLDNNPHETIDDIAYTWLFRTVGGTRQRAKDLLAKFTVGYIAKEAEVVPEVPEDIQAEAQQMASLLVTKIYAMSRKELSEELDTKDKAHSVAAGRWKNTEKDYEDQIDDLESKLDTKERLADEFRLKLSEVEHNNACLDESNEKMQDALQAAKDELRQLRETVNQQELRLTDRDEVVRKQQADIDSLRRKLDESHGTSTELSQQLQASKSDEALAVQRASMFGSEVSRLQEKVSDLEGVNNDLVGKLHTTETDKARAEMAADHASQRADEAKALYADQVETLKGRVADLEKQLQAKDKKTGK